jgi:hypothetical protein
LSELNKVVAHCLDGRIIKGTTQDFHPNRPLFHVSPVDGGPAVEIRSRELKGVFFVQNYAGNGERKDLKGFITGPSETAHGKKIAVLFRDGELLCGYSLSFTREKPGFFVFPCDAGSNNIRVYVQASAAVDIKAGPAADALAQKILETRAA